MAWPSGMIVCRSYNPESCDSTFSCSTSKKEVCTFTDFVQLCVLLCFSPSLPNWLPLSPAVWGLQCWLRFASRSAVWSGQSWEPLQRLTFQRLTVCKESTSDYTLKMKLAAWNCKCQKIGFIRWVLSAPHICFCMECFNRKCTPQTSLIFTKIANIWDAFP